jgi:hypothetical protein
LKKTIPLFLLLVALAALSGCLSGGAYAGSGGQYGVGVGVGMGM